MRRVLNHKSGSRWRPSVSLRKRRKRFGVEKETKEGERRFHWHNANRLREKIQLPFRIYVDRTLISCQLTSKFSEEGRDHLSLGLADLHPASLF